VHTQFREGKLMYKKTNCFHLAIPCGDLEKVIKQGNGTKYEQEIFFVQDPNDNILEIKTLNTNPE
jgi:extradiol dioxygenase family protein